MSQYDLELLDLRKVYPDGTEAVQSFDLQVEKGEFISFVGPSGCGKTTSLRMIAGLEDITSGQLKIAGNDFTRVPPERRPTATIFQNYAIFPHMSVYENIEFGLTVRKLSTADKKEKVGAILEKLHLTDVADMREGSLSGGQRQRLALARGLVTEPEILLLDEPLGALDANLRKSIQEELKLLQRSLNITFVFVTHAQAEALSMGDRVVVMNAGRVEQISAPYDLYTRPRSPFVARFIGRNKIIEGTLIASDSSSARVNTKLGEFSGTPATDFSALATDAAVMLVIPSEYVDIFPAGSPVSGSPGDSISGTVSLMDTVGQLLYVSVALEDGSEMRLETHTENLAGRNIEPGSAVDLRWNSAKATLVRN